MLSNIEDFMKNVTIKDKNFSFYEDEKTYFSMSTVGLLAKVEYIEADKNQYETMLFEQKIDKLDYEIITIDRPTPKFLRTKKEEDKKIIENVKTSVRVIYNVSNNVGIKKSFINKDDAFKLAKEINKMVLNNL